jgi:hypothetical protein
MIANIRPVDIEALEAREEEYKTVDMVTREALSLESGGD